ncbi:hypothetical protein C8R48DRAFT_679605 [Suillus tomentosus]|nr:hypothetical protein C8R48DRAFT_679605 [Suillus tomentosus]
MAHPVTEDSESNGEENITPGNGSDDSKAVLDSPPSGTDPESSYVTSPSGSLSTFGDSAVACEVPSCESDLRSSSMQHCPKMEVDFKRYGEEPENLTAHISRTQKYPHSNGGFGNIWKCILKNSFLRNGTQVSPQDVAVKSLIVQSRRPEDIQELIKKLRQEVFVWQKLEHSHILPLYGIADDFDVLPALVCPWMKNGSLSEYLDTMWCEQQPPPKMHILFLLVCSITIHGKSVHSKNIIHGDLMPPNVLIDENGDARLADFDQAQFVALLQKSYRLILTVPTNVLSGRIPYFDMKAEPRVIVAKSKGILPTRPPSPVIADDHWYYIEQCWSTQIERRPSVDHVLDYIKGEHDKFKQVPLTSHNLKLRDIDGNFIMTSGSVFNLQRFESHRLIPPLAVLSDDESSQDVTLPAIPELTNPDFLDVLLPVSEDASPLEMITEISPPQPNAMMDALRSTAHHKLTENYSPAFSSTLSATLDAFNGIRPGVSGSVVDDYLFKAWAEDPALTLRIIWSLRSIHDGKGDKELFYMAFGWLFQYHPRTALSNLHLLVEPVCTRLRPVKGKSTKKRVNMSHGYWKDLLNILALATVDELHPAPDQFSFLHNYTPRNSRPKFKSNAEQEAWSRERRVQTYGLNHARIVEKLRQPKYRALYIAVSRLFADRLVKDVSILHELASLPADAEQKDRWAPSPGGSHDRVTNITSAICILLHHAQITSCLAHKIPVTLSPSPLELHVLRSFLRRHILSPSRRLKSLPEPLMSANRWSEIVYSRVSSVCMDNNKEHFFNHDPDRFVSYLTDVESGKKHISGATLLPHELVMQAAACLCHSLVKRKGSLKDAIEEHKRKLAETQARVVEAQWATLLERLREAGELDSCIAVCDVSGSMGSVKYSYGGSRRSFVDPIWPAISLSLILARLAKPPFKDAFITFSENPQMVVLDPEGTVSLGETVMKMSTSQWTMNTNFNAVFLDLLLPLAKKHAVPQDQMIKRIFVFTDMQFDASQQNTPPYDSDDFLVTTPNAAEWETNHDVIEKAYKEAGYEMPEIVYWNLSTAESYPGITAPVTADRKGVALLNGYSPSLLKVFMPGAEEEEEWENVVQDGEEATVTKMPTPVEFMTMALGRKSFDGLVVID